MMGGRTSDRLKVGVEVMVVVVWLLSALCQDMVLGQQLPCPVSERNSSDCCPCQNLSLQCLKECPQRYFEITVQNLPDCQQAPADNASTATPPSTLVRCRPCHVTCQSCNGRGPEDCQTCADDHEWDMAGNTAVACVKKKDEQDSSGPNVGAIVGGVMGAVVVVVLVAVVVWLCYCRRRRMNMKEEPHKRSISTLMGPVGAAPVHRDQSGGSLDAESGERTGEIKEGKKSQVHSHRAHTYTNVESSTPKAEAIQQGHDKIFRYTRDPTAKDTPGQGRTAKGKKNGGKDRSENEELDNLPEAPAPPGQTTSARPTPPQDVYEIVDTPAPQPSPKPKPTPQPKPSTQPKTQPTQQSDPGQSYEIMDFPDVSSGTRTRDPKSQAVKARTTLLTTGPGVKNKRKTTAVDTTPAALSLPNPKAAVSCPTLPKFPMEEQQECESAKHRSQLRLSGAKSQSQSPPKEEQDKDYINVGPKKGQVKDEEEEEVEASDPEEDYVNTGPKKEEEKEEEFVPQPSQVSGVDDPAMDLLEEPQEMYGNQEIMDQLDRSSGYSNTPVTPPPPQVEDSSPSEGVNDDVGDQPTYGNDVSDDSGDDGFDYQNCPKRRSVP